jgi:hypothetical protein
MKIFLRALVLLLVVLWLGGVMFFPVVAASAFGILPDTHTAGLVVEKCLRVLHYEGLFAGTLVVLLLLAGWRVGAFRRHVAAPVAATLIMLGLTAFSQFSIIPQMDGYRLAVGGAIDAVPPGDPHRAAFDRLHHTSKHVEEGVLLAGIVLVVLLAWDTSRPIDRI